MESGECSMFSSRCWLKNSILQHSVDYLDDINSIGPSRVCTSAMWNA